VQALCTPGAARVLYQAGVDRNRNRVGKLYVSGGVPSVLYRQRLILFVRTGIPARVRLLVVLKAARIIASGTVRMYGRYVLQAGAQCRQFLQVGCEHVDGIRAPGGVICFLFPVLGVFQNASEMALNQPESAFNVLLGRGEGGRHGLECGRGGFGQRLIGRHVV